MATETIRLRGPGSIGRRGPRYRQVAEFATVSSGGGNGLLSYLLTRRTASGMLVTYASFHRHPLGTTRSSAFSAGGHGRGYRARDTRLGRDVAVKVLPEPWPHPPTGWPGRARSPHGGGLNHPNIVTLHSLRRKMESAS